MYTIKCVEKLLLTFPNWPERLLPRPLADPGSLYLGTSPGTGGPIAPKWLVNARTGQGFPGSQNLRLVRTAPHPDPTPDPRSPPWPAPRALLSSLASGRARALLLLCPARFSPVCSLIPRRPVPARPTCWLLALRVPAPKLNLGEFPHHHLQSVTGCLGSYSTPS